MKTVLQNPLRFSNKVLARLIVPLILEQFLLVSVGMADSMMVASVGEAAVSAVSLVDQINYLLIQIFAALATGGAVVASQYLGRKDRENACMAAKQLLYATVLLAFVVGGVALATNGRLLRLVFGNVQSDVMQAAQTYFWLSALSYPFLAVYNAGAALFRSMGNSKVSLFASLIMNVVNIGGNALFIYGFGMGVAGAALASLIGRGVAAVMMLVLLHSANNPIYIQHLLHFKRNGPMLRSILRVGVPNGIENGMFHVGKLLVASLVASLGITAMTANAIANNIGSLVNVPGSAVGLAMVTVVGQCVGAKDYQQARHYTRKMLTLTYLCMGLVSLGVFFVSPLFVSIYDVSQAAAQLSVDILRFFCVCVIFFWPCSFALPNALRAAGDARFTMTISMVSMWVFRVAMSYVLGLWLGWGLLGVWVAMVLDWVVRSIAFLWRWAGGKWQQARVIDNE